MEADPWCVTGRSKPLPPVAAHLRSGKLRALAVTGAKRTAFLPDTPGMEELNLPQASFEGFYAVAAPGRTPPAVIRRLAREIGEIMALPEIKEKCAQPSLEAVSVGPRPRARSWKPTSTVPRRGAAVKIALE